MLFRSSIKLCYGFKKLYDRGIILENWTDILIDVDDTEGYRYKYAGGSAPKCHDPDQYKGGFKDYYNMKLVSPWCFRSRDDVDLLEIGAEWSLDKFNIRILPGVLNVNNTGTTINIFTMLPKKKYQFLIPAGQPLVHIIPLTEKSLTFTNHLVTKQEFDSLMFNTNKISFFGWRKARYLVKRTNERQKCPFR